MAKKKTDENVLMYKNRPLLRSGDTLYYGFADDKYIISIKSLKTEKIKDLDVANKVSISLTTNETKLAGKERIIKTAEREGLYRALDIGEVWIEDALTW